jgi:dihydrofolate reductase
MGASGRPWIDIVEGIRRIKAQTKPGPHLIVWGSSTLTPVLLEHGLADEVLLLVFPVLLGTGKRIFSDGTPPPRTRARQHEGCVLRRHHQYLQAQRHGCPISRVLCEKWAFSLHRNPVVRGLVLVPEQ